MTKKCITCSNVLDESMFSVSKKRLRNQCKACVKIKRQEYLINNKEKRALTAKKYYDANQKDILEYHRNRYLENTIQINISNTKWRKENKGKVNALTNKRRWQQSNATPKWLTPDDFWLMEQAYVHAQEQTIRYGVQFHVDHIIPLQGKDVCGFHCPSNLQVIPWHENLSKGNTYTAPETWINSSNQ